jgi:hypothetical protein
MRWAHFTGSALALTAVVLAGCHAGPPQPLVRVKGQVTYRGKPVKMATVQMAPDGTKGMHAPTAMGQTDSDGSFMIQTPPYGSGATPGHYIVTVLAYGSNPALPAKYGNPALTPFKLQVSEKGEDNLVLALKD